MQPLSNSNKRNLRWETPPSNFSDRTLGFGRDLIFRGPLYAVCDWQISSPHRINGEANWQFWTKPRPEYLMKALENLPSPAACRRQIKQNLQLAHEVGLERHYDLSNEFFELFLDHEGMFYTCAKFSSQHQTLEAAQQNKARYIADLLELSGTERILELGSGWGGFMSYLLHTRGHQGEIKGWTLSLKQVSYALTRFQVPIHRGNFVTQELGEGYDRVVSIECLEHVRPNEVENVFRKTFNALRPGGRAVHQFFSLDKLRSRDRATMLTAQLFFPGSQLSTHEEMTCAAQRAGFRIVKDLTEDREQYKRTLREWYQRLCDSDERAEALVGRPIVNRFKVFFPLSWWFFNRAEATVHRLVLEKKR